MKRSLRRLTAWWFATMVPAPTPLTTIDEREKLRKRRLFSNILLINFIAIGFVLFQGFFTGIPAIQQAINTTTCSIILLVLWINRQGYLKSASLFYTFYSFVSIIISIDGLTLNNPIHAMELWPMLLIVPIEAGLILPAWGPLLLTTVELIFMNWLLISERQSPITIYEGDFNSRLQFFSFTCIIVLIVGILSTIYAVTTRRAVVQADRATELEQAHQELSRTYKDLEEAHSLIQKQALTDALTGLPNHRAIMDRLKKELQEARRYEHPFSLLFFDADRFKQVNDTHGHAAGDAVLRQIGELVGNSLRGGDTLGRFGGEEFVVLLPETNTHDANLTAERIRAVVAAQAIATTEIKGGIFMTISIGLASYMADGDSEQELLSQADEAMYVAKRMGRNQVRTAQEARQMSTNGELMALFQEERQREIAQREGVTYEQLRETCTLRGIYSLLALLEKRYEGMSAHAHSVSDLVTAMAQFMGIQTEQATRMGMAALLHDIGKTAIPDTILQKTFPLSSNERILLQEHTELGAQILEANPFLADLAPAVRHHHEYWNGHGYPNQLTAEQIPLGARIIAVAEAYDAMQRKQPYQKTIYTPEEAQTELQRCAGTQFDPTIVQALSTVLERQTSLQMVR